MTPRMVNLFLLLLILMSLGYRSQWQDLLQSYVSSAQSLTTIAPVRVVSPVTATVPPADTTTTTSYPATSNAVKENSAWTQLEVKLDTKLLEKKQTERSFYQNHQHWMQELFGEEQGGYHNFIVWDTRNQSQEFPLFFEEFGEEAYLGAFGNNDATLDNVTKKIIYFSGFCQAAQLVTAYRNTHTSTTFPHVAVVSLNENWGALSQTVPNKTVDWGSNLTATWRHQGCSEQFIMEENLNHPDTKLAVTTQFQIYDHPKVISLPLGIVSHFEGEILWREMIKQQQQRQHAKSSRTQLLMINCNSGPTRDAAIAAVERNFHGLARNSYDPTWRDKDTYFREMKTSKFVLTPGGFGFDCYRIWEALLLGTIPVLETLNRTDGWFRTLEDLPVAWIDSYDHLTPEWLEEEYQRLITAEYNYKKLTKAWWIRLVKSYIAD